MVKQTKDEKSLGIITRQFGHLPEPGWRPSNATPIEAWEGLILEDDVGWLSWLGAECLFRFGDLFTHCGPLNALCHSLARCRRCAGLCLGCFAVNCCCCLIPSWCRRNKRKVKGIIITHRGVTGSLPPKLRPGLRRMKQLVLFDNALHGNLKSIGHFVGLEALNLSNNRLTGRLPPSLGLLRSLRLLDLHGNALTGPLDEQCGKCHLYSLFRLTHVSLAENQFDGPFPSSMLRMHWLVEVHLSGCRLTGPLPDCQSLGKLRMLDLSFNMFTGRIPDYGTPKIPPKPARRRGDRRVTPAPPQGTQTLTPQSGRSSSRLGRALSLKKKKKKKEEEEEKAKPQKQRGSLPSAVKAERQQHANEMVLAGFEHGRVVGVAEVGDQVLEVDDENATTVTMHSGKSAGLIGTNSRQTAGAEDQLATINQQQAGEGSKALVPATSALTSLQTEEPERREEIDSETEEEVVAPCLQLRDLRLTKNRLAGSLPHGFGRLTNLARLDLSANKLTGLGRHVHWKNLTRLEHLDASRNKIEGPIPLSLVKIEGLKVLRLENNRLTGNIPDVISRLQNLQVLDLRQNDGLLLRSASEVWLKRTLKSSTEVKL